MAVKTYKKNTQVSENLTSNEFACRHCDVAKIDDKLITFVQKIRDHFGKPVTINSGYRCPTHNKAVGGASGSYHTKGMAADIRISGVDPIEIAKYAESIGVLGIGLYETNQDGFFVHIDTRTKKSFWYGQKQIKRETFGGAVQVETRVGWIEDATGWWYRHSDGSYTKSGWEKIGNEWFYFDAKGYVAKPNAWLKLSGHWFYMNNRSAAVKGYQKIDGKFYYFAEKGNEVVQECQLIITNTGGVIQ